MRLAICVIAYLDGSGDTARGAGSQQIVTLASIAAYQPAWVAFQRAWDLVVQSNGGQPIHAAALHYEASAGSITIIDKAVQVIADLDVAAFNCFACGVSLSDYDRALRECPYLQAPPHYKQPKPPEAICVDWCTGHLFNRLDIDVDKEDPVNIELVFDRNEGFIHWIHRVWTAPTKVRPNWAKKRRSGDWLKARITSVKSADMETYRELQAADVVAWVVNRHHTHGDRDTWYDKLQDKHKRDFKFYDYKALMSRYGNIRI